MPGTQPTAPQGGKRVERRNEYGEERLGVVRTEASCAAAGRALYLLTGEEDGQILRVSKAK